MRSLRWILAANGQAFEEEKFGFEQWPAKKPTTSVSKRAALEVDGKPLCQTLAAAPLRQHHHSGLVVSSDPFMKNARR